jgi:hypothetical protein
MIQFMDQLAKKGCVASLMAECGFKAGDGRG